MANARIARFITEAAPPQFVNVMRHRASKMLDTIHEEEKESSTNDAKLLSPKNLSTSSCCTVSASSSETTNSKHFLHDVQRSLSVLRY
ncbi:uncharacterized protein LOC111412245 [Olea europaea var. sylvestris]|uniref:uncharacterized protein LOC111412245 n=1 Tax=Olea europaea var. sylvestris TaxID=158386 RepID=UPI000C1D0BC4|nr:uncharacterized protein LOC111412245 [Olea europaea var. sylvestris]